MTHINIVTFILVLVFILPLIAGFFQPFNNERFRQSFGSLFFNIEFIFSLLISIYITRQIFFEKDSSFYRKIYNLLPSNLTKALEGRDIFIYIIFVPILITLVTIFLRLITGPVYKKLILPLADKLYAPLENINRFFKKIIGIAWNIPKSIFLVIIATLVLNFSAYCFPNPTLSDWMNKSDTYKLVYNTTLYPLLNSNIAKRVPVLVNSSFNSSGASSPLDRNTLVIKYFNGVKLEDAIKSTPEIAKKAKELTSNSSTDSQKAYAIYLWISQNVKYDYSKADKVGRNITGIPSGASVAYKSRTGICFDYSALYIAMCRDVRLKVRLITGLGFSGISWGDHAWNQVYSNEEGKWIDLDTTFGSTSGNYFNKKDFLVDHKHSEIQGEW